MDNKQKIEIPIMADCFATGKNPDYLFWVGCAGAFDDRYKKVTQAFAKILTYLETDFACLGAEESCTGDPAKRAGDEMTFQMQALTNIETFKAYDIKKIITICPHCFNILKNEYPSLGGDYEVIHHSQFLRDMMRSGKLKLNAEKYKNTPISFHDPCYLGRANGEYDAPREIIDNLTGSRKEMKRNRSNALCCGAGGAQMFKEAEKGDKEVYIERTEDFLETKAEIVATACPFCMTMLTDGIKIKNKEEELQNLDIAELIANDLNL